MKKFLFAVCILQILSCSEAPNVGMSDSQVITLGIFILLGYLVYLWCKYKNAPIQLLETQEDKCSLCGKKELTKIFCLKCTIRLMIKYFTIFLGIFCFPAIFYIPLHEILGRWVDVMVITYIIIAFGYSQVYSVDQDEVTFSFRQLSQEFSLLLAQLCCISEKKQPGGKSNTERDNP